MTELKTTRRLGLVRVAGLAMIAALVALSGCDTPMNASGQPGTVSVHMDGRVGSYVGATSSR